MTNMVGNRMATAPMLFMKADIKPTVIITTRVSNTGCPPPAG